MLDCPTEIFPDSLHLGYLFYKCLHVSLNPKTFIRTQSIHFSFIFKTNGRALASEPKCFNLGFKHPPVIKWQGESATGEMLQILFPSASAHAQKSLNDTKSG